MSKSDKDLLRQIEEAGLDDLYEKDHKMTRRRYAELIAPKYSANGLKRAMEAEDQRLRDLVDKEQREILERMGFPAPK